MSNNSYQSNLKAIDLDLKELTKWIEREHETEK